MTNPDRPLSRRLSARPHRQRPHERHLETGAVVPTGWGEISFESVVISEGSDSLAALFAWTGGPHTATIWTWVLAPDTAGNGGPASHGVQARGREVTTLLGTDAVFWAGSGQAAAGRALVRFALVPGPEEIPPPLWIPGPALADVVVGCTEDGLNILATHQWDDLIAVDFPLPP